MLQIWNVIYSEGIVHDKLHDIVICTMSCTMSYALPYTMIGYDNIIIMG